MAAVTCVLDASVILGLLLPSDAHHEVAVREVRRRRASGHDLVLPASALAEVLVGSHRVGPERAADRRQRLEAAFRIRPLDADIADAAARLRAQHRALRLPDALVLATGELEDAEVLTADAAWVAFSARAVVV